MAEQRPMGHLGYKKQLVCKVSVQEWFVSVSQVVLGCPGPLDQLCGALAVERGQCGQTVS